MVGTFALLGLPPFGSFLGELLVVVLGGAVGYGPRSCCRSAACW
jgi:NADH:ubiquinone oxidoreductase subunit 4 (subunit M)